MSIFEDNFITNFFGRRGNPKVHESDKIIKDLSKVEEQKHQPKIQNTKILEDKRNNELLGGEIDSVSQVVNESSTPGYSPSDLSKLISSDDFNLGQILSGLKADISLNEVYRENEEMSRDSVIGSAMEITADDICQADERTGKIVNVESDDEGLQKFLSDFLENNVNIEERIWTWTYEVVKHGDFKLRRREYYAGSANSNVKSVYYEDVLNPYSVSRIEYMGNVLGFEDDDFYLDSIGTGIGYDGTFRGQAGQQVNSSSTLANGDNSATFEKADSFVHFLSAKLSRRDKIVLNVKGGLDEKGKKREKLEPVVCYKVTGTSIMDNARYIFRIINMLDNMLILSRVARSTQYNLVKVEVGNASPGKTQQILSDIRRRLEGSTRLKKNVGMKTDPSPIPINSNVYIPTRDGKGDVTVDSIGDTVDVRSIVDIDYFKDKEFASIKFPKAYLGFEESIGGVLGNNSLAKMDIRYARSVQRVQNIMVNGIKSLCNNYLIYRGRLSDINKFKIRMRPITTSDTMGRVEEYVTCMSVFDSSQTFLQEYAQYIDKAKFLKATLGLIGLSPSEIASEEFMKILQELEKGTYKEENHKVEEPSEEEGFE